MASALNDAFNSLIQRTDIRNNDQIYYSFGSDRLEHVREGWGVHAGEWRNQSDRVQRMFDNLAQMLNSNQQLTSNDTFSLALVHVKGPPRGGGKSKYTPGHCSFAKLREFKRSISKVPTNTNNLCCALAICSAKQLQSDSDVADYNRRRRKGKWYEDALLLQHRAGIPLGIPCGPNELERFAQALPDYTLIVVDADRCYERYVYGHGTTLLGLLYSEEHYDTLSSLSGFFNQSYFCGRCLSPYNTEGCHSCPNNPDRCPACTRQGCIDYLACRQGGKQANHRCNVCRRLFYGESCYLYHCTHTTYGKNAFNSESSVCAMIKRCPQCFKMLRMRMAADRAHVCGNAGCPSCHTLCDISQHKCFVQTLEQMIAKGSYVEELEALHIFFDIEAMQVEGRHIPNLLIAETDVDDTPKIFEGESCTRDFIDWLDELMEPRENKGSITVIAHNFKGYDSYPIINAYTSQKRQIEQLRNDGKCLQLKVGRIHFIDSMSFFPMALSTFSKTFDLRELKKGYFPHFFNVPAHQHYRGPLPAKEMYGPHTMTPEKRFEFEQWYDTLANDLDYVFDFQQELHDYCISDVKLLKAGCLKYRHEFESMAHFNPFTKVTIAAACSWDLRRNRLQSNTIASEPLQGWRLKTNHSDVSMEWLLWVEHQERITLQHARNVGENQIPGTRYTVDGFHPSTNTVYEFRGCYWHGCPTCYPQRTETHRRLLDRGMFAVYHDTRQRLDIIRNKGYTVKEMWECEWQSLKSTNVGVKTYLNTLYLKPLLKPRDAFFGGRTNAIHLYAQGANERPIAYYDFTSLYPFVNKTSRYLIGHPTFIYNPSVNDISTYFGLIHCTILPPYRLFHPVLPYRYASKLVFPLCAACTEEQIDNDLLRKRTHCPHSDSQRALTGTWCTPEVQKAIEKGYRLVRVHEVWHFPQSTTVLFKDYVDTWLKLKQESSGWPKGCDSPEERAQHVHHYAEHEGIHLDADNISNNPGRRTVAKLALNSMWGKFGQNTNKMQVKEFTKAQPFHQFLQSDKHDIRYVSPLTEQRVEVHFRMQEHMDDLSPNVNIFIACFTTTWARLRLYEALDLLQERVLYFDTDSIFFYHDPQLPNPPLGPYLGDFKNELSSDDYIVEFCSGGPKNYGYRTSEGNTVCKIRGFSLNCEGAAQLNYEVLKQNVLSEISDPLEAPRTTPIVESTKIVRHPKTYTLSTQPRTKEYRLVFNKRVLKSDSFISYPYGYDNAVNALLDGEPMEF